MTRLTRGMLALAALAAHGVGAQKPLEFKANVKMVDASDGSTATGVVYFGGAKMRTELTKDGQNMVVLSDPVAKSQLILMPDDKMYMQMPFGQGPITVPITGPADPTNPCAGGSGATDCVKGAVESISGYQAVRWDYTSKEGTRTRAWVSTKLRFPVKVEDDDGARMEFSNIAEGPQPASLFSVPAGYTKMDIGAMGGAGNRGGGRGRSSAGSSDPMAAMMANLPPEAQAAMAKAMRGATPQPAMNPAGSAWEKGKGWVVSVTVVGTESSNYNRESGTGRETYTAKLVASIPLNYGTPGIGVPGAPGPMWTHMASEGMGSPEAYALPLTLSVEAQKKTEGAYKGSCGIAEDSFTSVGTMKAATQKSVSIKQGSQELRGQAVFKISGDLKTYDLIAGAGSLKLTEETHTHFDRKSCRDGHAYSDDKSASIVGDYAFSIDVKGNPLPAAVGVITGSKKIPLHINGKDLDATVTWTLTPIR